MYDIAIIGGMGPAATAELFRRIVLYTSARTDQEHIKLCVLNDPTIPDRTEFILNGGISPLLGILKNIDVAKKIGCKYFAIPCNTSHYFYQRFSDIKGIKFINMVKEACKYVIHTYPNKNICVLATLGTISCNVYKNIGGKYIIYPSRNVNVDIMEIIHLIKAGESELSQLAERMLKVLADEFKIEDTVFLLACTELSLLLPYVRGQFVDAMDILAGTIIIKCNKSLNSKTFKLHGDYFCLNETSYEKSSIN